MLVNNQPNIAVACRADIQCISVLLCRHLGWWYWQRVNASQKWLQAKEKDDESKIEKGEQRERYACAQSLFVWRTRTLDRRRIWLVMMVAFWLLAANQNHVFFRFFRLENLRLICSLLEIFDGSRDQRSWKTSKRKGTREDSTWKGMRRLLFLSSSRDLLRRRKSSRSARVRGSSRAASWPLMLFSNVPLAVGNVVRLITLNKWPNWQFWDHRVENLGPSKPLHQCYLTANVCKHIC